MLQILNQAILDCYLEAEHCARNAKETSTKEVRGDCLDMERRWLALAESMELSERLNFPIREAPKSRISKSLEYRRFARACLEMASIAEVGKNRTVLIHMSDVWLRLAQQHSAEIIGASKVATDVAERKRNDEHIAVLAREAEHRIKNILATVQATVNLSDSDTADRAIEERIQALANVHSLFVKSRWDGAELSSIVTQELAPYLEGGEARVQIDGPLVWLPTNMAQGIAITFHELATNAVKYGSLSVREGHLCVNWSCAADGQLTLHWTESGGPPTKKPTRRGFGMAVIEQMIRQEGEIHHDWRAEGLACEIVLQTSKL
jgi:two-component sensor histidine kinase